MLTKNEKKIYPLFREPSLSPLRAASLILSLRLSPGPTSPVFRLLDDTLIPTKLPVQMALTRPVLTKILRNMIQILRKRFFTLLLSTAPFPTSYTLGDTRAISKRSDSSSSSSFLSKTMNQHPSPYFYSRGSDHQQRNYIKKHKLNPGT